MAKLNASIGYTSNAAAKKGCKAVPTPSLEASVVEIVHHTMALRRGRTKVAQISRERNPLPNEGGFLAYFWGQEHRLEELFVDPPPAAPMPIAAGQAPAESPVYSDSEMEVEDGANS